MGTRPEDLSPNNFSPVGSVGSHQEYQTVYDQPIPEQMDVFARHADYTGWAMMLRAMGTVRGCDTPSLGHYEEPWKDDTLNIGSVVTPGGGAGNSVLVALTAGSMYNTGTTIGGSARQASYVLPKDVVELPSGVQARVESKTVSTTPHRVTLKPLLSTVDLDAELAAVAAAGQGLFIVTNLFGEGTGSPGTRAPRYVKYQNTFGIVKSAWGVTGSEWTTRIYPEVLPGQQGSIRLRLAPDAMRAQEKAIDGLLLFGQQANNIVDLETDGLNIDVDIAGVEGFIPFAKTSGTTVNPTLSTYSTADLDAIVSIIEDERSTMNNTMLGLTGSKIHTSRENGMQEFFSQNLAPFLGQMYGAFSGWDSDAVADTDNYSGPSYAFGVSHVQKGNIDFFWKKLAVFNDIKKAGAKVAGVPVYEYPFTTIYQPLGGSVMTNTAKQMPTIGYEYKESGGLSRHLVVNQVAGAGTRQGLVSHDKDYTKEIFTSEIAPHYACGNRIVYESGT